MDRSKDGIEAKETARKMMKMVRDINTNTFGGRTQVPCNTCHNGHNDPAGTPALPEFSVAVLGPGNDVKPPALPSVDQVLAKYVQSLGGEQALRKVFVVSGTRQNYTAAADKLPPPVRIEQRPADFYPPLNIKDRYQRLAVRTVEKLGNREAYVVTGVPQGGRPERFYFDTQSGLLLRHQRNSPTAVGNAPFATDYDDYRDAGNGIRMPFVVNIVGPSRPDCASIKLEKVQFTQSVGEAMHTKPNLIMPAVFLCFLVIVFTVPGQSQGRGRQLTLPDGPGKDLVQMQCTKCHALGLITNAGGNSRQEWVDLFTTMVKLPNDQRDAIADYLAANFPPQPRPQPVVISGPVMVTFKEWNAPTLGSRPHDPEPGPVGTIWWTGMFGNVLGRLDPKTGDIKEYPVKTPASGPHGLEFDKDGYLWFTANTKGYIGKLEPKTGEITEYKLPPEVRDPHTPLFAPNGMLFFTAQNANYVGRLNPKTGEIKVQKTPTEKANPYGMVFNSKGIPFVCDFGTNKIIQIDPETLAIKEYELPNPDSRPRRIAISPDDIIWYADYSRGYLGRLDPKTGKVTEWASPSGPKSQPYGITYLNGAIWYVESAIRPNVLVRFDIKSEKFQSWTIPGGGGVVRNMKATPDGNLVIAESGVNKVGLVLVGKNAVDSARR